MRIVTAVDAVVAPEREAELLDGFQQLTESARPEGLLSSVLLRGQEGRWRIETTWRDLETLKALRASGDRPAAADPVEQVGATHSHDVFSVERTLD